MTNNQSFDAHRTIKLFGGIQGFIVLACVFVFGNRIVLDCLAMHARRFRALPEKLQFSQFNHWYFSARCDLYLTLLLACSFLFVFLPKLYLFHQVFAFHFLLLACNGHSCLSLVILGLLQLLHFLIFQNELFIFFLQLEL